MSHQSIELAFSPNFSISVCIFLVVKNFSPEVKSRAVGPELVMGGRGRNNNNNTMWRQTRRAGGGGGGAPPPGICGHKCKVCAENQ